VTFVSCGTEAGGSLPAYMYTDLPAIIHTTANVPIQIEVITTGRKMERKK